MKRYFVTGLLIWVPLGITLGVLTLLVRTMDQTLLFLVQWQPEPWSRLHIPVAGVPD